MLIIETTRMIFPRFKRFTSQSVTGGANNYICFAMMGVQVTVVRDAKAFRDAVRRYAQDDWSEHKQVRLAAKKARSKARAQERKWVAEDLDQLQDRYEEERDARFAAEAKASYLHKVLQAMKLTFNELKGGE
ncbi:hypothetical protein ACTXGL_01475 [Psychrobacter sp. T6-6]|uniref:hypothetical protein n=1 Tax=Psychrobacter sp. T6-6 TaxID=3457452 RepID=UPI003FD27499